MKHFYLLLAVSALCLLTACASAPISAEVRTELSPRGTLRGVHVDLACALAKRAGVLIELIG